MIQLLAIAPEDGWAFLREGEEIYLIRPPYSAANRRRVAASAIETAVAKHGFKAADASFEHWQAVIDYLKQEIVRSWEASGRSLDGREIGLELLQLAEPEKISQLLDRAEEAWLRQGKWNSMEKFLCDIVSLDVTRQNASLSKRAADLLKRCQTARQENLAGRMKDIGDRCDLGVFPRLSEPERQYVNETAEAIKGRGQVLPIGAYP
jgi:hypothetical protein